jgi:hypothetical protein
LASTRLWSSTFSALQKTQKAAEKVGQLFKSQVSMV